MPLYYYYSDYCTRLNLLLCVVERSLEELIGDISGILITTYLILIWRHNNIFIRIRTLIPFYLTKSKTVLTHSLCWRKEKKKKKSATKANKEKWRRVRDVKWKPYYFCERWNNDAHLHNTISILNCININNNNIYILYHHNNKWKYTRYK